MNYEMLEKLAREAGFEQTAPLNPETIKLKQEVRDMCVSGKCARYGRSWSCPPHAGSLEECGEKIAGCREGILVQTVQEIEDTFNGEGMMESEQLHKERFNAMQDRLAAVCPDHLAINAGTCMRCRE